MSFLKSIYRTFLEALFPTSPEEREVLAMDPELSWKTLPRAKNSPINEACGIYSYKDQRIRKLIWSIKYKKSQRGSEIAAYALNHIVANFSQVTTPVILVPMPITKQRRRERGFNQCELIADKIEKLDNFHKLILARNILSRKLHHSRQTMKNREERLESSKNIFVADNKKINNMKEKLQIDESKNYLVLVIDDVITTGSTILDAINTLRKAGLTKTFGLTVAH